MKVPRFVFSVSELVCSECLKCLALEGWTRIDLVNRIHLHVENIEKCNKEPNLGSQAKIYPRTQIHLHVEDERNSPKCLLSLVVFVERGTSAIVVDFRR